MTINALRDIKFLRITKGRTSVRNALLTAHDPDTQLDLNQPAYIVTSQLRLLAAVTAVALRHTDARVDKLRAQGLEQAAIDAALEDLSAGCDPFDATYPFMQRPVVPAHGPKDAARKLGPGEQPVKKLSPSMPPDDAEEYWNLANAERTSLPLADAILQLVVFHYLSMAGNNAYDGDKCQMGSPAMRFVGTGKAATEICVVHETLLDTLLSQIPTSWVHGAGLPAWADRRCEVSLTSESGRPEIHPLWAATWSSNAPACYWEDERLTGVRTGGIPEP
ncbi:type I-E CRISPR-associated protein Cse1/CasA [Corynebacterium atypicum]|uniref:type I-E CRISPR-associated protein Cse1/CasA n=1 Tax=Corynebacterium atypicum TaxID=191610 RepID=UPI00068D8AF7|nr:type I-E CRISPR-associated protein Cse1/CasA [Corynebacterium atypicum]